MNKINSIVGRFDGVVSYENQEWGSFHCQIEKFDANDSLIWSIAETFSESNIKKVYADSDLRNNLSGVFEEAPFISSFTWTNTSDSTSITSAVFHLYLLITDNTGNTYPVSVTYDDNGTHFHSESATDIVTGSGDESDVLALIKNMVDKIIDSATIS